MSLRYSESKTQRCESLMGDSCPSWYSLRYEGVDERLSDDDMARFVMLCELRLHGIWNAPQPRNITLATAAT